MLAYIIYSRWISDSQEFVVEVWTDRKKAIERYAAIKEKNPYKDDVAYGMREFQIDTVHLHFAT